MRCGPRATARSSGEPTKGGVSATREGRRPATVSLFPLLRCASMHGMTLVLEVVTESLSRRREHVFPEFQRDPRFNPTWWHSGSAKSPVSYCRFLHDGEEVGRAKVLPASHSYGGYTTWSCPPGGATEIDLIEIRPDLRRSPHRYGRQAVEAIGRAYGCPVIAMSLDATSDLFWEALGWTAHAHPDANGHGILFTST